MVRDELLEVGEKGHLITRSASPRCVRGRPTSGPLRCGLVDPLDTCVGALAASRRVRLADDLPLPSLVDEAVADPKLHRQDPACGGLRWLALLPLVWPRPLVEPTRAPDLTLQREGLLELSLDLRPRLRAPALVEHRAQKAIDAQPRVPETSIASDVPRHHQSLKGTCSDRRSSKRQRRAGTRREETPTVSRRALTTCQSLHTRPCLLALRHDSHCRTRMRLLNLSGGVDVALLILQPATEDRAPTDSGERIRWPLNSRNPQETVRNPQRNRARDFRKFAGDPGTMGVERIPARMLP